MQVLGTICARVGSKGLKKKNFLKIKNLSLLSHTLYQAIKITKIKNIIISTDFSRLKIKKNNKIFHINRPKKLAGDFVGKLDVIRHALHSAEKIFDKKFDVIIDLDVTSPLRKLSDINNAINLFKREKSNNLITICNARKNPYFNMIERKKNKMDLVKKSNFLIKRRQDAPKVYELNASIYIWKKKYLLKTNNLFSKRTSYFKMPYKRSIDIDNIDDFKYVKYLMRSK